MHILKAMVKRNRELPGGRIRLLVFDLDGTLVDSQRDLTESVNAMLRHFGKHELPTELVARYTGDGAPMLVRRALGDPDDQHYFHEALDYFVAYYRQHKLDTTRAYLGVPEALEALRFARDGQGRALQRAMAVLTNKPVNPSRQIVQALGLGGFFFQVYGGNSFSTKKPDPQGIEVLMQEAGAGPEETLIIGDSDTDIVTGQNAGTWTCGVTYGFGRLTIESPPPDLLVDDPQDLVVGLNA